MITRDKIDSYIEKIPPASDALVKTLDLLNQGELVKAANAAKEELALNAYLKNLVNKPIYGLKNEVSDISQIFGILGVAGSQQVVYSYMISLLSPDKWYFFKLKKVHFENLQAELSANWKKILNHLKINNKEVESSVALLPASIIVAEALFNEKKSDVELLRSNSEIDLNTILQRLCKMDLFDICEAIATKWDMSKNISLIIQASSGVKPSENKTVNTLAKWMHLLFFYTLSKPAYIEAGLNDFIDFQVEFVEDIYEEFNKVMEIS